MQYYFLPEINETNNFLNEEESRHCIKVLRKNINEIILITNGKGILYEAKIINPNPKKAKIEIIKEIRKEINKSFHLHIAIAPTKNTDRFETFLEKATEIGIDEITPIICENSERDRINYERLNKILISAMKQSLKLNLPLLNEIIPLKMFLERSINAEKYIAYCNDVNRITLSKIYKKEHNAMILIGPEGDFSENEIKLALKNNFVPVSLGESRLRTETAGIVACHTINLMNN